jgi:hypothetical protein
MFKLVLGLAIGLLSILAAPTEAQERKTLKRNSVGNQEIELSYGISLDRSCQPLGPIRIAVVRRPKHGKVLERPIERHTSFKMDNPRHTCNAKPSPGVAAFYQANDKFSGIDRFQFAIVYYDGTSELYDVEMVVWRP